MAAPDCLPIFRSRAGLDPSVLTPEDMVHAAVAGGDTALVHADSGTVANWQAIRAAAHAAGVVAYTGFEIGVAGRGRAVVLPKTTAGLERIAAWTRAVAPGDREVTLDFAEVLAAGNDCVLLSPPERGLVAHAARFGGGPAARATMAQIGAAYGEGWSLGAPTASSHRTEQWVVAQAQENGVAVLPWRPVGALARDAPDVLALVEALRVARGDRFALPMPAHRVTRRVLPPRAPAMQDRFAWLRQQIPEPIQPVASPGVPLPKTLPAEKGAMVQALADRMVASIQRKIPVPQQAVYFTRLEQELEEIAAHPVAVDLMGMQAAVLEYAHTHGVRPVLRGSAVNRLALVRLTDFAGHVDPVRDDLLFARFLNGARAGFDVDLDVRPEDRAVLEAALAHAYGADDVLRLATMEEVNGVQALRYLAPNAQQARAWARPFLGHDGDPLKKEEFIARLDHAPSPRSSEEAAARRVARRVHGVAVGWGMHAPGYVIVPEPVRKTLCTQTIVIDEEAHHCVAAPRGQGSYTGLGLTKIDLLNSKDLACLAAMERVVRAAGGVAVEAIPLEDPQTLAAIRNPKFRQQIPQLRGKTANNVAARVGPQTTQEVVDVVALARPGTLALEPTYLARRAAPGPRLHPAVADITAETHGVYLYQEQLMESVLRLGGTALDAEAVYRAMKSGAIDRAQQAVETVTALARTSGFTEEDAQTLQATLSQSAGYMFAKGHALQYGRHAYAHAYYRAHYPELTADIASDGSVRPPRVAASETRSVRAGLKAALRTTTDLPTDGALPSPAPHRPSGPSAGL